MSTTATSSSTSTEAIGVTARFHGVRAEPSVITSIKTAIFLDELVVDITTAYLLMLMEEEESPQNDLDSFRGHLLIGSKFFSDC